MPAIPFELFQTVEDEIKREKKGEQQQLLLRER